MPMISEIDFDLPRFAFRRYLDETVERCVADDCVLPLPFHLKDTSQTLTLTGVISAAMDCRGCTAPCCRSNPHNEPLEITGSDIERLVGAYSLEHLVSKGLTMDGDMGHFPMPCPFLIQDDELMGRLCSVYECRPLLCQMFPMEMPALWNGIPVFSLSSRCKSARKLYVATMMNVYDLQNNISSIPEVLKRG